MTIRTSARVAARAAAGKEADLSKAKSDSKFTKTSRSAPHVKSINVILASKSRPKFRLDGSQANADLSSDLSWQEEILSFC